MLSPGSDTKIYLFCGYTDMRKGINGLSLLAESIVASGISSGSIFVFRGKSADRIKILWWDTQGFCLFYKCFDSAKITWLNSADIGSICITRAQLAMLLEGIDWRTPKWSKPPEFAG
jgi:transposase